MTILKALSVASASAVLIACGIGETAKADDIPTPKFTNVDSYSTTISANNDTADIYYPRTSSSSRSFPIALFLQGANVDKSNYSNFARIVASYGFVVVVPNHQKTLPLPTGGFVSALFSDTSQINAVLAYMKAENTNPTSPVAGIVDTTKLGLLGHSAGGAVGLSAIANLCIPSLCEGSFSRPNELKAGAFFGANLRNLNTQEFIPINNSGIPVALLQGNLDSIALPINAQKTYEQIQNPPKAFITILGANHYGITNINNPPSARPDLNVPTLAQDTSVQTVAHSIGLFLRASVLNDKEAIEYISDDDFCEDGGDFCRNITVEFQKQNKKNEKKEKKVLLKL